ncbi:hypothetical protein [Aureimonas psammosilenae]|uniref:hypothetical protein n=1 Tax=Aureimonas psammosilenae TaxID=2495496 RepID=UPI001260BF1F|nr:hypothetical protein [Aureimonas psammosilenae]
MSENAAGKPRFEGVVDGFGPADQLSGWARAVGGSTSEAVHASGEGGGALRIRVLSGNEVLGIASADQFRKDLGGPHGFSLRLSRPIEAAAILAGLVRVEAFEDETASNELVFYSGLLDRLPKPAPVPAAPAAPADEEIIRRIRQCMNEAGDGLRRRIADVLPYISTPSDELMVPTAPVNEISMVGVRPGLRSANEISIVGRDGYLFVYRGSNDLKSQYEQDPADPIVGEKAAAWVASFEARRGALATRDIGYLQIIVPEKSSVLPELYPVPLRHPTTILADVEARIGESPELAKHYLDCRRGLRDGPERTGFFMKVDTHMSVSGTKAVFEMILGKLGHPESIEIDLSSRMLRVGDLGGAYPGASMWEFVALPKPRHFADLEAGLVEVEGYRPPNNAHLGSRFIWRNDSAKLPLRVVAFANSFFERGTTAIGLSWWAARWFREFHFLWSPEIDFDYVDRVKPDWVICQTIERFLPVPPVA